MTEARHRPGITRDQLAEQLRRNLHLAPGDLVAVHSSMRSLGPVEGGAVALIDALLDSLGGPAKGTLLMPSFTHAKPETDLATEPCRLGLVPETFRRYPGVLRSTDPTHSVAVLGAAARELAGRHDSAVHLSVGSPLHALAQRGGSVLLIGCDLRACSLVHVAEYMSALPFLHLSYRLPCARFIGRSAAGVPFERPATPGPGCSAGYLPVQRELERRGWLLSGSLGAAPCLIARGAAILEKAYELLVADPAALLCDRPSCTVCNPRRAYLTASETKE